MIPKAQVDFIIAQGLLNFWATTGVDMDKVWEILEVDSSLPYPRRVPADRISAVYRFVSSQLNDPMIPYDIGSYMGNQPLSDFQVASGVAFLARLFANSLGNTMQESDLNMVIPAPLVPSESAVTECLGIRVTAGENFLIEISKDAWVRKTETADPATFLTIRHRVSGPVSPESPGHQFLRFFQN